MLEVVLTNETKNKDVLLLRTSAKSEHKDKLSMECDNQRKLFKHF